MGNFSRVLLDAPCSGTGVISKDPTVKAGKTEDDIFRCSHLQVQFQRNLMFKIVVSVHIHLSRLFIKINYRREIARALSILIRSEPLIQLYSKCCICILFLQKELILAAIDSCNASDTKGGYVVYCTCSIMVCQINT